MRLIPLPMIRPDMILAKSVYYNDCLVLKAGQKDLGRFVSKLKNLNIDYLYVEDPLSEGIEIPDVISEDTRVACKKVLRNTLDAFAANTIVDAEEMSDTINSIIDDILENSDVQISLNDIGASDEYTFSHSVSTTVYSLVIAKQLGYSKPMMEKLAAGTLLHDVGKTLLDKRILNKTSRLEPDEYEHVKQHTVLGYEVLKKCRNLTELSRIISLYHHERMDGSGYPTGAPAGQLHEFSRIVAIADVYDALVNDRCYRKKWSANQAVNFLVACSESKFDTKLVSVFIKQIAIYPNGTMIRLSNGRNAIVKEQNHNAPLRPVVRVISDEFGNDLKETYEIDLMKELAITIVETDVELIMDWNKS